jgi:hypothetical protein
MSTRTARDYFPGMGGLAVGAERDIAEGDHPHRRLGGEGGWRRLLKMLFRCTSPSPSR